MLEFFRRHCPLQDANAVDSGNVVVVVVVVTTDVAAVLQK